MKFIHCADIHLDSKIEAHLSSDKAKKRKREVLASFCNMVDFANENEVKAVIIAGDLFDSNKMSLITRDVVLGAIEKYSHIDFLYLTGNHDAGKSLLEYDLPKNLKLFKDQWTEYDYGNVAINGAELTGENCRHIYGSLNLDKSKFNIVTMHGGLSASSGEDKVNRTELSEKGIDYLALGHYHTYDKGKLGDKGVWCYSGCLEGRGFDECGDKGFVLLDIKDDLTFTSQFIKTSQRNVVIADCDITSISSAAEIMAKIQKVTDGIPESSMLRVVLKGRVPSDSRKDLEFFKTALNKKFWYAEIQDKTRLELHPEDYINDISLKGEFIRNVMASDLSDEIKDRIIECGITALNGEEVNL